MKHRNAWLALWPAWVPAAVLVTLNVVWLGGVRGILLGRGSLLASQVSDLDAEVGLLEGQLRQYQQASKGLGSLQTRLADLRQEQLAPMHDRLVPFLTDLAERMERAGLRPQHFAYLVRKDLKSGLYYFSVSFAVKGSYEQFRHAIFLFESSPQFIVVERLGLHGQDSPSALGVDVDLAVGTYFSNLDERLMKELGATEVTSGN
jgi:hypothetical protein